MLLYSAKRPCCLKSKSWSNRCLLRFITITGMRQSALHARSSICCHSCLRACSRPKLHSARYKQFTSAYTQRVHTNKRRCYRRVSAQTDNGDEKPPPPAAATPAPRDDDVRLLFRSSFRRSSSFLAILPSSVALPGLTR